jgi:dihydrofolate reductase
VSEKTPRKISGNEFRQPIAVAMIVARAENGVIGQGCKLPWHISADLQHFKKLTVGKPIVMGRKTYESIGRPLPRRTNIVVTRNQNWAVEGTMSAEDLPSALVLAYEDAHASGADEVMVVGGAEVYRQALVHASRIYLTEVHAAFEGDAILDLDLSDWSESSRVRHKNEEAESPDFSFVELRRDLWR